MARNGRGRRRRPRSNPSGILKMAPSGFGFVQTAEGEFFIPASKTGGAFDGDMVEVLPSHPNYSRPQHGKEHNKPGERPSARVVRVLHRAHETVVGRYEVADPFGVVVPEDHRIPYDIFTMRSERPDIPDGAIVRVRMVEYPTRRTAATGVIEEVLGTQGQPGLDIESLIARYKLETRFSEEALAQAQQATVDVEGALRSGYRDLRDRFVFTIDPADARDFDDALSVTPVLANRGQAAAAASSGGTLAPCSGCGAGQSPLDPEAGPSHSPAEPSLSDVDLHVSARGPARGAGPDDGSVGRWRLGVHIADVAHYVEWGGAIDLDARRRATSTYLVDRVLPMLPEKLSNEVCSLAPGAPRRAFTVDIVLDDAMNVLSVDAYPSIIESRARLSYDQADCYLDAWRHGQGWRDASAAADGLPVPQGSVRIADQQQEQIFDALAFLTRFAQVRAAKRQAAGGMDFDTAEAKVVLDESGAAVDVNLRRKTPATSCVEEAMILANECVAERLRDTATPGIFRVHEAPAADALARLVPVLQEFGYAGKVDLDGVVAGNPHVLQDVLAAAQGRVEAGLVSQLVLRSMQRAVYRPTCDGHYGLASSAYCHFTSPIRRYPDLVVHRMLRSLIQGRSETFAAQVDALGWLAEHSSEMERVAESAARESQDLKIVEYMRQFVGQQFDGIVVGVATYGLYVQLPNTAEGLLHTNDLGNEYFSLDPAAQKLTGSDTGRVFRLGQQVRVVLHAALEHATRLEFRLADFSER